MKELQKFQLNSTLFLIPAFINRTSHVKTLINGGSKSYGLIDARVTTKLDLPYITILARNAGKRLGTRSITAMVVNTLR